MQKRDLVSVLKRQVVDISGRALVDSLMSPNKPEQFSSSNENDRIESRFFSSSFQVPVGDDADIAWFGLLSVHPLLLSLI